MVQSIPATGHKFHADNIKNGQAPEDFLPLPSHRLLFLFVEPMTGGQGVLFYLHLKEHPGKNISTLTLTIMSTESSEHCSAHILGKI